MATMMSRRASGAAESVLWLYGRILADAAHPFL
jgi:hypothetical protein